MPLQDGKGQTERAREEQGKPPNPAAFGQTHGTSGLGGQNQSSHQESDAGRQHDELRRHADAHISELVAARAPGQHAVHAEHENEPGPRHSNRQGQDYSAV